MRVLVINAIVYTSETRFIKRADSIKDSMIYDLCLAFHELGHEVTLFAAEPYKPVKEEEYPFHVIWAECKMNKLFAPHRLPFMPELIAFLHERKNQIDLIISSEVFSMNSFIVAMMMNSKLLVWHELAQHNAMLKRIPSLIWYNVVARLFMRKTSVIARSLQAKEFIRKYCPGTMDAVLDHGVNLQKFQSHEAKEDSFVICSQLIRRKRIDGILEKFKDYLRATGRETKLYIIGDGDQRDNLEKISIAMGIEKNVEFKGKMRHEELLEYLSRARALLVNTEKDNSMISIVESIAVGTPVVTTKVPLNAIYIEQYELGIAAEWDHKDLCVIYDNNRKYVLNCLEYRQKLSTITKAKEFISYGVKEGK